MTKAPAQHVTDDDKPSKDKEPVKTCFVIMPISDVEGYPDGHFAEVYSQLIEPAVRAAGYVCSLASSTSAAHMIQLEVVTKVATADLCICDLSTNNPNVLFEYGIRQAFDKPTVLLKDDITRRIFDLSGFRDIEYDHNLRISNILTARKAVTTAIEQTVAGAKDDSQIFSLVKLMKLTKAALPSGDISQDDARFTLIERKLDSVIASVTRTPPQQTKLAATIKPNSIQDYGPKWSVNFLGDAVQLLDNELRTVNTFYDPYALEKTDFWSELDSAARKDFASRQRRYSPNFLAF